MLLIAVRLRQTDHLVPPGARGSYGNRGTVMITTKKKGARTVGVLTGDEVSKRTAELHQAYQ